MTSTGTKKPTKTATKSKSAAAKPAAATRTSAAKTRKAAPKPPATPATPVAESPIPTTPRAAVPDPAAPVVVKESAVSISGPDLKKQELLSKVVARSGIAKRDAKPVVEAMLELLGEALHEGRDVNLNPMGKIIVKKSKPVSGGTVLTTRIRLKQKI